MMLNNTVIQQYYGESHVYKNILLLVLFLVTTILITKYIKKKPKQHNNIKQLIENTNKLYYKIQQEQQKIDQPMLIDHNLFKKEFIDVLNELQTLQNEVMKHVEKTWNNLYQEQKITLSYSDTIKNKIFNRFCEQEYIIEDYMDRINRGEGNIKKTNATLSIIIETLNNLHVLYTITENFIISQQPV